MAAALDQWTPVLFLQFDRGEGTSGPRAYWHQSGETITSLFSVELERLSLDSALLDTFCLLVLVDGSSVRYGKVTV